MSSGNSCSGFYSFFVCVGNYFQHLLLLALRLYWGWGFQSTGLGKFINHAEVAHYFSTIGVPAPELMVWVVAAIEFVGGWCLILGLASRIITIPLIAILIVALLTAHMHETLMIFSNMTQFVALAPITYLLVSLVVFAFGPGCFSIDALIGRRCSKKGCSS